MQRRHGVGVGVARMHDERQAGLARRGDVGAEAHLLGLARRMLVEIVEPGLADADHLVVAGQLDQPLGRLLALLRSEEHTSELQSLMRISYAVFCLKKKK